VPPRGLPGNANLEQLKNGAKSFQRTVRAGDPGAAEVVNEFHPRLAVARPGAPELAGFTRADALLVVARRFDFPSWAKLKAHLELVERYSRSPHAQPIGQPIDDESALADEFLRLGCLNYGEDDPAHWERARELLDANPWLAGASIYTAAAVGDVGVARGAAGRRSGVGREARRAIRLGAAAVPDLLADRRWPRPLGGRGGAAAARARRRPERRLPVGGLVPPFTALTGVFGSGGGGAPSHTDEAALARLLLQHGADPNDDQTLFNRAGTRDDDWLELLFEFGLGSGESGPWRRLLGERQASPREMLEDLLIRAAHGGFADRVRLLLAHGVDPAGMGTRPPIFEGRAPIDEAVLLGYREVVELLAEAGAQPSGDDADRLISACMAGDRTETEALRGADPTVVDRAIARRPEQLALAAEKDSLDAVELLIELGFDVNAGHWRAPLHEAAMRGNLATIRLLLDHGADPNLRDRGYDATPRGWAEHHGMTEAEAYLAPLTEG
jgi:hypothetical protein